MIEYLFYLWWKAESQSNPQATQDIINTLYLLFVSLLSLLICYSYIFYKIQPYDNKNTTKYYLYTTFYATSFLFNPHTSFGFIFRLFSSVLKFFFGKSNYLSWYGIAQVDVVVVVAGITPRTDLTAAVEEMQRCKSKLISNTHPAAASASLLQSHHARRRTRTSMRRVPGWACQRARSCHTFPHHHRTWTWESCQVQSPSRTSTKWQRCVSTVELNWIYYMCT